MKQSKGAVSDDVGNSARHCSPRRALAAVRTSTAADARSPRLFFGRGMPTVNVKVQ